MGLSFSCCLQGFFGQQPPQKSISTLLYFTPPFPLTLQLLILVGHPVVPALIVVLCLEEEHEEEEDDSDDDDGNADKKNGDGVASVDDRKVEKGGGGGNSGEAFPVLPACFSPLSLFASMPAAMRQIRNSGRATTTGGEREELYLRKFRYTQTIHSCTSSQLVEP